MSIILKRQFIKDLISHKQKKVLLFGLIIKHTYTSIILNIFPCRTALAMYVIAYYLSTLQFVITFLLILFRGRMTDNQTSPYRRRFNTEIISKTEIALEAIRRHDMNQSNSNIFPYPRDIQRRLLNDLDKDYSMLTSSRKIEAERVYRINLPPYSQQFYSFDMANHLFPLRVLFKNVRNDGIFYAGYDFQYPGVAKNKREPTLTSQSPQKERNYDYRIAFNKDILINLKNTNNKTVKCIYFSFIAGAQLLLLHFKVQPMGSSRDVRFASEVKLTNLQKSKKSAQKQEIPRLTRQKTEPIQVFKQFARSKFPQITRSIEKPVRLGQFQVFPGQISKNGSKPGISPQGKMSISQVSMNRSLNNNFPTQFILRNDKNGSLNRLEKADVSQRLQQIKKNKSLLQIYKQKDKQLRETASKCKKLIDDYKKIYNQENARKCKLNRSIVLALYSSLFINAIHQTYKFKTRKAHSQLRISFLCKKFINKLKKKHQQSCNMIHYRLKRVNFEASTSICLESRLIHKQSTNIASDMIRQTLQYLMPIFSINRSLSTANIYRNKLKLIQRVWRSKYHSRLYSLHYFIDNHVLKMSQEYPYLKLFIQNFYKSGANKQIALNYIKDQSQKYRFIYEAYQRKLEQIDEMIQANKKIMLQGGKKPKLTVPKRPLRPMHRFYRNCDILKSMVRSWFEIQYKKYYKKSFPKYTK